jgi:hypothetical protein
MEDDGEQGGEEPLGQLLLGHGRSSCARLSLFTCGALP